MTHDFVVNDCRLALTRQEVDGVHFITTTFLSSLQAMKGLARDDAEVAKYYPEGRDFLLEQAGDEWRILLCISRSDQNADMAHDGLLQLPPDAIGGRGLHG